MSKRKLERRFNKRGRLQPVETKIDDSEEKKLSKILVGDYADDDYAGSGYDASNALILPSKKRRVKLKYDVDIHAGKKLSKKEKKRLEKIVEVREKKKNREAIFETLKRHRATDAERAGFASLVQRRHPCLDVAKPGTGNIKINVISGSNKKPGFLDSDDDDSSEDDTLDDDVNTFECVAVKSNDASEKPNDNVDMDEDKNEIAPETGVPPPIASTATSVARVPARFVSVDRRPEVELARSKLPIIEEEQRIVESVNENPVTIVCGETGSGKTTQVPQFLYEAGYCEDGRMIGVTEPRRVAAIAMAERVADEMNLKGQSLVAYQIRYEKTSNEETSMKFMTDGVLLKEIQSDFLLSKYSVVIIDEAHERSVYSDILIGLLSRIVPLRAKRGSPLKLLVMSATLRVEDFTRNTRLFKTTPPCLNVDARQFPVTVHFNKKTPVDFVEEAFKKTSKIHRTLPDGGILIFVTGRQEVHRLCSRLRRAFPVRQTSQDQQDGEEKKTAGKRRRRKSSGRTSLPPKIDLDNYLIIPEDEESTVERAVAKDGNDEDDDFMDEASDDDADVDLDSNQSSWSPLHVLPLYSMLSPERQRLVFASPPSGRRLCVVATNVAETSLTIPDVRYVIDCGKVKTRVYDRVTGVSAFTVTWTSKASSNQRAGRAGRTAPGHCYRLFSSAVFNDQFPDFSPPEITMRPVDDLFLHMKDIGIDKVINFPFPTPPSIEALVAAERLLVTLGALEEDERTSLLKKSKDPERQEDETFPPKITKLGKLMALFPISPRYSKMLALGHQHGCLPYVIAIISALTVQEVLFQDADASTNLDGVTTGRKPLQALRQKWAGSGNRRKLGDLMVLLKAVGAADFEGCSEQFCFQFGLRWKAMSEIKKLRSQLTGTVNSLLGDSALDISQKMEPPSEIQAKLLCQIILAGCGDRVARKLPKASGEKNNQLKNAYETTKIADPVFIHPSSVLFRDLPEYVVYQETIETSKVYMKGIIAVEPQWLPVFAESRCDFDAPLDDPPPYYCEEEGVVYCHQTSTFGPRGWRLPAVARPFPTGEYRFRWFAKFLLEGTVASGLAKYSSTFLSAPSIMIKSWSKLQPRTQSLLSALGHENVCSRDRLKEIWSKEKTYLLKEFLEWIPEALHHQVSKDWPPLF